MYDPGEKSIQLHWQQAWKLVLIISRSRWQQTKKYPGLCLSIPSLVLLHWDPFYWQEWLCGWTSSQLFRIKKTPHCSLKHIISPRGLTDRDTWLCYSYLCSSIRRYSLALAFSPVHLKPNIHIYPHVHYKADICQSWIKLQHKQLQKQYNIDSITLPLLFAKL